MGTKIAFIVLTKNGLKLALRLKKELKGSQVYVPDKLKEMTQEGCFFNESLKDLTGRLFQSYDALVYFASIGLVVRVIANYIRDKRSDPAIVVVDDKGSYAISLLCGHGGANMLARKIAEILGAQPIITTASDVWGTISVDLLGKEFGWTIEFEQNITKVSASIVNGEPVALIQETGERNWWEKDVPIPENITLLSSLKQLDPQKYQAFLIITDKILGEEHRSLLEKAIIYRPKSLVLGIGCHRGVEEEEIEQFVFYIFSQKGLSFQCLRNIATIEDKRDEEGLLNFARKYDLPIEYFSREQLNRVDISPSESTLRYLGVKGVCEPAAMLSSGARELIVEKTKTDKLAIAIARIPFK